MEHGSTNVQEGTGVESSPFSKSKGNLGLNDEEKLSVNGTRTLIRSTDK
jgi:hypothetical protein